MADLKPKKVKKPLHEYPEKAIGTKLYSHVGMDSKRHNGIHTIDQDIVITFAGNVVLFTNIKTGEIKSMLGPAEGGIGAVCVHPSHTMFVVCEKSEKDPYVIVYEYPSLNRLRVMRHGAVRGYSACAFNDDGTLLATVAQEPDFMITVWNWKEEKTVLRNKAFGSDVYDVVFNPYNQGMLVSSGMGHIKFWTMSETFTGLKLQGHIGKFGRVELSDITGTVSLPDGKVVSGSESGSLLLWEGNLIKCELVQALPSDTEVEEGAVDWKPCHTANIPVVKMIENGKIIMSAAKDGYIRYWSTDEIDAAENNGLDLYCKIRCLNELYVGDGVEVQAMTLSFNKDAWVILDAAGAIRTVPFWGYDAIVNFSEASTYKPEPPRLTFNSGAVLSAAPSPTDHTIATGGEDGTIRLVDYITKKSLFHIKFDSKVTTLQHVDPAVDKSCRLLLAGFDDGCLRLLRKAKNCFEVLGQWRPHAAGIKAVALDKKGGQLYTIAVDRTAFYFTVSDACHIINPVGYCDLPEEPTSAEWAAEGDACFVSFSTGNIIALNPPATGAVDPEVSFKFEGSWSGLGIRQKMRPPPKEKKVNPEDQSSSSDDDEEEDQGPWPINVVKRLPNDKYAIATAHPEMSYVYKCDMRYPDALGPPPVPATGIDEGRVEEPGANVAFRNYTAVNASVSYSGKFLIMTCTQSRVLIRPIDDAEKFKEVTHSDQLHDGVDGDICHACTSYDDQLLLTVANDGMLVVQTIGGAKGPSKSDVATLSTLPQAEAREAAPIANSIQRQKELDDQHRAEEAALGKKTLLLRKIHAVHKEYENILNQNDSAIGGMKLSLEDIQLDSQLLELLEVEKTRVVDNAALEFSWRSAQKEALLRKLREYFIDNLEFDRFMVHGFENSISVCSLRTPKFTAQQRANIEAIERLLTDDAEEELDDLSGSPSMSPGMSPTTQSPKLGGRQSPGNYNQLPPAEADDQPVQPKSLTKSSVKSQLEKAEERKEERILRRKGLTELLARKPKQSDEDPKTIAEIVKSEQLMGDYILKSDPNHTIPDHLRPTAERKAKQLTLLEHSIHQLRSEFNQRLLGMRDLKERLCESVNADKRRIQDISKQLKVDYNFVPHKLVPNEQPERRFAVDQEGLERFEAEQEKTRKKAEALERAKKGFGADLATMDEDEEEAETLANNRKASQRQSMRHQTSHQVTLKEKVDLDLKYRLENIKPSELEDEEAAIKRETLLFEKSRLERRVQKTIGGFDESLAELFHERLKLDADLAMADMRVLLLFREHQLLQDFKLKDLDLAKKLEGRESELREVARQAENLTQKFNAMEEETSRIEETLLSSHAGIEEWLHEHFTAKEHFDFLKKIFNRKIKRRKHTDDLDDDDNEATSEEDSADEDDDGFDDVEEVCPAFCPPELWTELLSMRESKLNLDYAKMDGKEKVDGLKKEFDDLNRKQDQATKALLKCKSDIDEFQRQKQKELNKLETIVVLKLSQIQCLTEQGKMPAALIDKDTEAGVEVKPSGIVVFTQAGMNQLRDRIHELAAQKESKRRESDGLGTEKMRLLRRKNRRQTEHNEWEAKVYEVQLLKFGQRVDLEMLENVAVDRETEELKERLKLEEIRWERELSRQNDKLLGLRQEHQGRIGENTVLLKDLGSLRAEQYDLEQSLQQSTQKIVAKMSGGSKVATAADRAHLKDLVVAQQQEIDALKNEIAMLRRKGGHVYTPVVNQMSQSA